MAEKQKIRCYRSQCANNNSEEETCSLDFEEIFIGESGVCIEARISEPEVTEEESKEQ